MRNSSVLAVLGILLALATPYRAAQIVLSWELEHKYGDQPWVLTKVSTAGGTTRQEQLRLTTYEEYNAVLATLSPNMTQEQDKKLWAAYEAAQQQQDALYEKMRAEWETLAQEYQTVLAKYS